MRREDDVGGRARVTRAEERVLQGRAVASVVLGVLSTPGRLGQHRY